MGCRNCGNKSERHTAAVTSDVIEAGSTGKGFAPPVTNADPMEAMLAAKQLSYEQLTERREFHQRMILKNSDSLLEEMTDAMRRVHVDELISVYNGALLSLPGITPSQAVMTLHRLLQRTDFAFIEELYPGLTAAVNERRRRIMSDQLPGPKSS
jgi:hypothetical protein